jgi:hypothetical protein
MEEVAMAGKNIAVFAIYPHGASFEYAFGVLKERGFRDTDVSVLLQENPGTKDLAMEKASKAPEGQPPERVREQLSEARLAGWQELARWRFLA